MSSKTALAAALLAALTAALLALPAGASVQVGSSGWQWGNPLPQGNTLRAMSFTGTTGYAAGDFGTLLKTTDGGSSWSGLPVGTFQRLGLVQALDADVVFAGGGCVARRSVDGGRTFTSVAFATVEFGCRAELRDLSFVSRDVGYLLLDDGSVFTTTDGGTQFAPRTAVPETGAAGGSAAPGGLVFLDASKGYATSGGKIFQTLDGGVSWRGVGGDGRALNRLWFADAQHGFAVGRGGALLRSDDGGATWTPKGVTGGGQNLTSIRCTGPQLCVLTTESGTELLRTVNGGDTPATVITASTDPLYAAAFASSTRVAAGGQAGASVRSDNAGETFTPVGGRLRGTYGSVRAGGAVGTAFATGNGGALAKTTDGGRSWVTGNVPTTASLIDVSFPSAQLGYALDADGGLFRTDDGGAFWRTLGTGSTRRPRAVTAPGESTVLVVGPRGVRRSADQGETFDQVRARAVLRAQLDDVTRTSGGTIVVSGPTVVARSGDGGRTWTRLPNPGRTARERRGLRIDQVAFSSAGTGMLSDSAGRVWRTTNGGRRWTLLTAVGTQSVIGISIRSARVAQLVVTELGNRGGGYLLRTADGGRTWQPQFVVDGSIQTRGLASGGGTDYLLAGDSSLLFSTTGGVAGSPSQLTLATRQRRPMRAGRITVTGRLRPAGGRAQVVVSALAPGRTSWQHQTVNVASNGTFATAWRVPRGTTTFVAQWAGDFKSAGAGSQAMTVTVAPRR